MRKRRALRIGFMITTLSASVSWASHSNTYEGLLRRESLAEYPNRSAVAVEVNEVRPSLESGYYDFIRREMNLVALRNGIESYGRTPISFYEELHSVVDRLSERDSGAILRVTDSKALLRSMDSPELEELRAYYSALTKVKPQVKILMQQLDDYIVDAIDFSMALTVYSVRRHLTTVDHTSRHRDLYGRFIYHLEKYLEHKDKYGQGPDNARTSAFQKFMRTAQAIYKLDANGRQANAWNRHFARMRTFSPGLVVDVYRFFRSLIGVSQPAGQLNPVVQSAMSITRRLSPLIAEDIIIEGQENIPMDVNDKEIYLFTPTHRHDLADQAGVASLGVDNFIPFMAVDNFVPPSFNLFPYKEKIISDETGEEIEVVRHRLPVKDWLIKRINRNLGLIVAGKKAEMKAIDKIQQILSETDLRNILIYPGGRLPEGLGHTMGVREKFMDLDNGLIGQLEAAGYSIHIVPISMRDNARLVGTGRSLTRKDTITVKVAPVLRDRTRRVLTRLMGAESLGLLMRLGAIDDLVTNEELIFGGLRASRAEVYLAELLTGSEDNCGALLVQGPAWSDPVH